MPSDVMFNLVCKHLTSSPLLPCFRVLVIVQVGVIVGVVVWIGFTVIGLGGVYDEPPPLL